METETSKRYYDFLNLFEREEIAARCVQVAGELKGILLSTGKVFLGAGHTRKVYSYGTEHVLKIPLASSPESVYGTVKANLIEYLISKRIGSPFVPCEMYFFKGFPVLVAEKVLPVYGPCDSPKDSEIPELLRGQLWDGYQIGLDRNENVVCYDCGCEDSFLDNFPRDMRDFTEDEYRKLMSFSPSLIVD